jgi:hypothetical protein
VPLFLKLIDRHWSIDDKVPLVNALLESVFFNEYNAYNAAYDTFLVVSVN